MDNFIKHQSIDERLYPSLMIRVQALLFDLFIVGAIVFNSSRTFFSDYQGEYMLLKILLFVLALLVYESIANTTGGTLGYRTMGLKIRRFGELNKKLRFSQAFVRSIMKFAVGWISFLSVNVDPHRRAMHDKASGAVVLISK
jgi:uncharacterized RDD family membrane protein YckC